MKTRSFAMINSLSPNIPYWSTFMFASGLCRDDTRRRVRSWTSPRSSFTAGEVIKQLLL